MHPVLDILMKCIRLEEEEQTRRYRLDQAHTLRQLKTEGLALHPLQVTRKNFGYADYPEISFRLLFPAETGAFRDGASIECFVPGEEPVKGVLITLEGKSGEFRLYAPDFPDWIEDDGLGIKLAPDTRTTGIMKKGLEDLEKNRPLFSLFETLHDAAAPATTSDKPAGLPALSFQNKNLNPSQQSAVSAVLEGQPLTLLHGPPGTGKTTTLAEAVFQLVREKKKVLVTAPSNTAVDNLARALVKKGIKLLRVGNLTKVDETLYPHTPEGRMKDSKLQKEIKALKKRAEEFRRMALKYKRSFGKSEREQRNLLFKEVRNIRNEIKQLQQYHEEKLFSEADVIAGTPVGLYDEGVDHLKMDTLVMDEAGQCVEPLAWCVFPLAEKIVLAGDPFQLPPTVISPEAARLGFNRSILEVAMKKTPRLHLLDTQYRMRASIAGFSSRYFYKEQLQTAPHLSNEGDHICFIDTAGSGFEESRGPDGSSLQNKGELDIIRQLLAREQLVPGQTAFLSPYAGQVSMAKEQFPKELRVSTIDSFQGQEKENIILSLVRSNGDGDIGFLKDYRRMNVALTRAKEKLFVIGDSATIGADPFYREFLEYAEKAGQYRTVWEFDVNL